MESDSETESESDSNDYIDTIIRDITALVARLRRMLRECAVEIARRIWLGPSEGLPS